MDYIQELFAKNNLDAILITSTSDITYFTGYAGFSEIEREAYMLLTKSKKYLFTDGRYIDAVKNIAGFTLLEISCQKPLSSIFENLAKKHAIKKLGVENTLTIAEYKRIKKYFQSISIISLDELRIIKKENEIKNIELACQLGDKTFELLLQKIKDGVTEKELSFEIEFFIKKNGGDISFKPIVAFGEHAAIPHHQTSNVKLENNNWVLLDFGAKVNNYCSDMTRTVFFGSAKTEQRRMYETVLEAQQKAIDSLTSLILNHKSFHANDADKVARDHIIAKGYPSIPHSLGHGIGLEVHEAPYLSPNTKDMLKPCMVFSVEPGIYLSGVGGVRIEDLVVLEEKTCRLLTKSPREFIEI